MSIPYVTDGVTEMDSALFNPWIDRLNGLADGTVPISLAGITDALWEDRQAQGIHNVLDYGAVGDGVTDDTAAIQAAVAAASPGDELLLPFGKRFLITSLSIGKRLHVAGYGATLVGRGIGFREAAAGSSVVGLTIEDSTWTGITINASRVTVRDCRVVDSAYIGIFIETNGLSTADVVDCVIEGCEVDRTGIAAGSIVEGGIKVHGYAAGPYDVIGTRIIGNVVRMPEDPSDGTAICIEIFGGSPYSVVTGNTTFGGSMGISNGGGDWSAISGNVVHRADSIGIECAATKQVTVIGNAIDGDGLTSRGVSISNDPNDGIVVSGNTITGCVLSSIYAISASKLAITGNQIERQAAGFGIELTSCESVTVSGNVLDGASVGTKAVMLDKTGTVAVVGNTMRDWTENGVMVFGDSAGAIDYITIIGNTFDGCTNDYGTQLSGGATLGTNVYVQVPFYAGPDYTLANVSADRTFDPTSTNDAEVAQVLGTLITDLQTLGVLR